MKIFILALVIFFIFASPILADNFGASGSVETNRLYMTTAIGYSTPSLDISYNEVDSIGLSKEDLLNRSFTDYASYMGDSYRRLVGIDDRVLVPPSSKIYIYSYIRNETEHPVDIKDFIFFASRTNPIWGTWESLGILGASSSLNYKIYGNTRSRLGFRSDWPSSANIPTGGEVNMLVGEFTLPTFIEVVDEKFNTEYGDDGALGIKYIVSVKNNSNINVKDVIYSHDSYFYRRNYSPQEIYTYEYTLEYGSNYILGENKFYNYAISVKPEVHECAVIGSTVLTRNSVPDSKSLFLWRNDLNDLNQFLPIKEIDWYPGNEGLCIEVLPYWIFGNEVNINIQPLTEISMEVNKDSKIANISVLNLGGNWISNKLSLLYDERFLSFNDSCNALMDNAAFEWDIKGRNFKCDLQYSIIERDSFVKTFLLLSTIDKYIREEIKITPDIEVEILKEGDILTIKNNSLFPLENFILGERKLAIGVGESIVEVIDSENLAYSYKEIVGSVKKL